MQASLQSELVEIGRNIRHICWLIDEEFGGGFIKTKLEELGLMASILRDALEVSPSCPEEERVLEAVREFVSSVIRIADI